MKKIVSSSNVSTLVTSEHASPVAHWNMVKAEAPKEPEVEPYNSLSPLWKACKWSGGRKAPYSFWTVADRRAFKILRIALRPLMSFFYLFVCVSLVDQTLSINLRAELTSITSHVVAKAAYVRG